MAETPWRNVGETIPCPVCAQSFTPAGRQRVCSAACRQALWRRRHAAPPPAILTPATPTATVYACPSCDARYLGQQRCPECGVFCRRVGLGGLCPHCDEPVAFADLTIAHQGKTAVSQG
jgi:hypothetical protein